MSTNSSVHAADLSIHAILRQVAEQIGTPSYVYCFDAIEKRIQEIDEAFGSRFLLSYAIKANPNRALLRALQPHIPLLDASSSGELVAGTECGYDASRISFSGPGKTTDDLQCALQYPGSKVVIESVDEAKRLNELCLRQGTTATVLVRVSPEEIPKGFGVSMAGRPCQFGIDEQDVPDALPEVLRLEGLRVAGFHIYAGTQCLDNESLAENIGNFVDLFERLSAEYDVTPQWLIFGAGIGIPYHDGDEPADLSAIAETVNARIDQMRENERFSQASCVLELGRFLVGEAGYFLTKVIGQKTSRGRALRVCDGGMNHHLAACGHFGSVIHRNYPIFKVASKDEGNSGQRVETYDLFGPLCTTIDIPGRNVTLPALEVGDLIGIGSSGAYGLTASPVYFISHRKPREVLVVNEDGQQRLRDITADGTPQLGLP